DLVERAAHAHAINLAARRERADHPRGGVAPGPRGHPSREEKRLALALLDAAAELPAHQRMQLGVLVDRALDGNQQAGALQRIEMVVQVGIAFGHSTVMFFARTMRAHFAWSSRSTRPRSSGVPATMSQPWASKRSRIGGSANTFTSTPCRRSMVGLGVAAGATIATQDSVSKPG